ncbi:family 1 polysaccharide lyase [Cryphonectria parasitica EP155]|uniref:pectin lyase n=1 Tax=Cryphonectria parasitica (strain ATCC 38755 / EP155) TaxID=660469 RepID=A0A9P5CR38_CRYP1|nr:family 1 polysaccharide lyase [Cryphonectria parasitica EP155]KAF3766866.1 family 1 polysaccharide lyase [Cryphonectria parasitica EP155]
MRTNALVLLAGIARQALAATVTGAAEGFAKGVTGGGTATPVYPTTTAELVSYLGDSTARVIVIEGTFDFTGSEGTTTSTGCAPWGTAAACQVAINQNDWCTNYEPDAPSVAVSYDNAGVLGITVNSNKSLVGKGGATIKGKGIRMVGVSNVIIQNVAFTDINPRYVWGGDAITLDGTDLIWIDHVTTSLIGRQHIVLGTSASQRVTISNCYFDGVSTYSATCDGHHYWGMYFDGSSDLVTFKNNYIYHMSGRSPKVAGNTLLHAVNNYWYDYTSTGHAFEVGSGAMVLAEGNVFQNVPVEVDTASGQFAGQMFSVPTTSSASSCAASLGRNCVVNIFGTSGTMSYTTTSFLTNFAGKNIAAAAAATSAMETTIPANAGNVL